MIEEWRDVVGFEDFFLVSSKGRLFSKRSNRLLKLFENKKGYCCVATRIGGRNGQTYCFKIHRLVAEAFISNPENLSTVNHINGVKDDNNVDNLEWLSASDNTRHAFETGLSNSDHLLRSSISKRKLSDEDVRYIREYCKPKCREFGLRALALRFGVTHNTISHIFKGIRYVDVE